MDAFLFPSGKLPLLARASARQVLALIGIGLIGVIDNLTGLEIRVYPLYFLPLAIGAWGSRTLVVLWLALAATALWIESNTLTGLTFSRPEIWWLNAGAQFVAFMAIGWLIARLSRSLRRERQLARTDGLTGVLNALSFHEEAGVELERCRRYGHPVTVAFFDLDAFKQVNDRLGHRAGDKLLQRVAAVLISESRASDLVARLGGDEFAALLPETDAAAAHTFLERVRQRLATLGPPGAPVTVSIGAMVYPRPPGQLDEAIHASDDLMYVAKRAGKDRIELRVAPGQDVDGAPVGQRAAQAEARS